MVSFMLLLFARKNSIIRGSIVRGIQRGFGIFSCFSKNLVYFCLRTIQGINVYRWIARSLQSGTEIKEADAKDMKAFYAWFRPTNASFPESHDPNVTNFVAKRKNKIIGFVQLVRYPENTSFYEGYWLFCLMVRTLYRGMGIGKSLSQLVIERARAEGAKEILLFVYEDNHRAINLYRKLGFNMKLIPKLEVQLSKELESHGRRQMVMAKSLSKSKSV